MGNPPINDASRLGTLLERNEISQAEFAAGIRRSKSLVSRMVSGEADPSKDTIDTSLAFLSFRLGRAVTYEEAFGTSDDLVGHGARA